MTVRLLQKNVNMQNRKNILFVIFLLLIGIVVYLWYASLNDEGKGIVAVQTGARSEVANAVTLLKEIDLNEEFFLNEEFLELKDFSIPVALVTPRGGSNPFLNF